jgi:hypothetical protein
MARKTAKATDWNSVLAYPIKLRDGDTVETLRGAIGRLDVT